MWCESQRGWVLLPAGARALCPRLEERQTCVCVLISFFFSLDGNQACTYNRLWRGAAQVVPGSHFRVSFSESFARNPMSIAAIKSIATEEQLEELLSRPNGADIEWARRLKGDVMVLGAGGKMGPSLALRARRAIDTVGMGHRVIAVSRFSEKAARELLERQR